MTSSFELSIPIVWQYVRDVRARVRAVLASHPPELRDAAVMVASELVENAIKYGESVPKAPEAVIRVGVSDTEIRVEVSNGVRSTDIVRELRTHIEQITNASNRGDLYVARVEELLNSANTRGRLGLYRIGHEGGFELSCSYVDQVLTVTATRGIS